MFIVINIDLKAKDYPKVSGVLNVSDCLLEDYSKEFVKEFLTKYLSDAILYLCLYCSEEGVTEFYEEASDIMSELANRYWQR